MLMNTSSPSDDHNTYMTHSSERNVISDGAKTTSSVDMCDVTNDPADAEGGVGDICDVTNDQTDAEGGVGDM